MAKNRMSKLQRNILINLSKLEKLKCKVDKNKLNAYDITREEDFIAHNYWAYFTSAKGVYIRVLSKKVMNDFYSAFRRDYSYRNKMAVSISRSIRSLEVKGILKRIRHKITDSVLLTAKGAKVAAVMEK